MLNWLLTLDFSAAKILILIWCFRGTGDLRPSSSCLLCLVDIQPCTNTWYQLECHLWSMPYNPTSVLDFTTTALNNYIWSLCVHNPLTILFSPFGVIHPHHYQQVSLLHPDFTKSSLPGAFCTHQLLCHMCKGLINGVWSPTWWKMGCSL